MELSRSEVYSRVPLLLFSSTHLPVVMPTPPVLIISCHLLGSGHDWGGLATEITNNAPYTVEVLHLEMVPWFFRLYLHTLLISEGIREY